MRTDPCEDLGLAAEAGPAMTLEMFLLRAWGHLLWLHILEDTYVGSVDVTLGMVHSREGTGLFSIWGPDKPAGLSL